MRIILFVLNAILVWVFVSTASAQSANKSDVPISQIEFVGGKLVQEDWNKGIWVEYDFRSTKRYNFIKTNYDKRRLSLQGLEGNVQLIIDLSEKTISGEWPGHPMGKLYDVTNIDYLNTAKPIQKDPRLERVIPNYVPPGKSVPSIKPPKKKARLSTETLGVAQYRGGLFYKVEGNEWRENASNSTIFRFKNIGYNNRSIFLYDISRNILIELDIADNMSRISHDGEALNDLYALTSLAEAEPSILLPANPQTPMTPISNLDGKMNTDERAQCSAKGGFVERAGMLGHERCTMLYNDGGNICIDTSNCEGKCLATVEAAQGKAVSGQCQKTDNPFGCYTEVIAGSTGPALCVD